MCQQIIFFFFRSRFNLDVSFLYGGIQASIKSFGAFVGDLRLTKTVQKLLENATAQSTNKTYQSIDNQFLKFVVRYDLAPFIPTVQKEPSIICLIIIFYTAHLVLTPTINAYSTVYGYVNRLRSSWKDAGYQLSEYDSSVVKKVLAGARRLMPKKYDSRLAYLLPHYDLPEIFLRPVTLEQQLMKVAVIWGFIGMFRYSTYHKLGIRNLTIVGRCGREFKLYTASFAELQFYFIRNEAPGFFFEFPDKYHPIARAFFCRLDHLPHPQPSLCPVSALMRLSRRHLLKAQIFPFNIMKEQHLSDYLHFVARVHVKRFAPHSLRIGGHTFYSIKDMNGDFVDFLARRAISKASQRYYRARALDNMTRLLAFFTRVSKNSMISQNGGQVGAATVLSFTICSVIFFLFLAILTGIQTNIV